MIEIRDLSKRYGPIHALDGVSLTVHRGSVTFLLGPNGAGKSTLLNIICGVLSPDSGEVSVCGHDMLNDPVRAKRSLGCVFEDSPLYADMTVVEQLAFTATVFGMGAKDAEREIERVIQLCDLEQCARRGIARLSKGTRQRVSLAQALVHVPKALVLDEPASGLDPLQGESFLRALSSISRETAILYSTHSLREVESIGTDAIILHEGKVVESGGIRGILDRANASNMDEAYSQLISAQGVNRRE